MRSLYMHITKDGRVRRCSVTNCQSVRTEKKRVRLTVVVSGLSPVEPAWRNGLTIIIITLVAPICQRNYISKTIIKQ